MFSSIRYNGIAILIITAILLLLTTFIISILYYYQKKQFAYFLEIDKLKSEHENILLSTQLEIQESTIQSISRDIHDNINLTLTLAKLNLITLSSDCMVKHAENIKQTIELVSAAINDLSNLSKSMNADLLKEQGLLHALSHETEKIEKLGRFKIKTVISGESMFMDFQKELFIFRIIQEALNNILKHSCADRIWLDLQYNENALIVLVRDNGIGFGSFNSDEKKNSTGILNMQKRAALIGGSCSISSEHDKGTTVILNVPY